jgi:hypothetical protein
LAQLRAALASAPAAASVPPASRSRVDEDASRRQGTGPGAPTGRGVSEIEGAHPAGASRFCRNAGLVLLHPFLKAFLAACGVRSEGGRIAGEALPRAAALLHLVATGEAEPEEADHPIVDVLLGLGPGTGPRGNAKLVTPTDREEADALLAAAASHWTALKNTSPAGLREAFLRRVGVLQEGAEEHLLRVEPAAFDALLDRLPWAIGVVRLPWMPKPIFTEWPTR